ncbi:MAG: Uncharacterised protein [Synechococcus sp. CC9902]|nr:MAG: Uncharacterised protein [Synechococcus sp. CC9902]
MLLIPEPLLRELSVAFLLEQRITLLPCGLKTGIHPFKLLLQSLPALGITTGFHTGFLGIQLLELRLQWVQACLQLIKPQAVFLLGLLQLAEFVLTLLHAFKQWSMGTLGGLAFRLQSSLALLSLAQCRPQLIHGLHQSLLLPSTGGQGLSQLQQSLSQRGGFIAIAAGSEAQPASALREATAGHGTTLFK